MYRFALLARLVTLSAALTIGSLACAATADAGTTAAAGTSAGDPPQQQRTFVAPHVFEQKGRSAAAPSDGVGASDARPVRLRESPTRASTGAARHTKSGHVTLLK